MVKFLKFWISKYQATYGVQIKQIPDGYTMFTRLTWDQALPILNSSVQIKATQPTRATAVRKRKCCGR